MAAWSTSERMHRTFSSVLVVPVGEGLRNSSGLCHVGHGQIALNGRDDQEDQHQWIFEPRLGRTWLKGASMVKKD